MATRCRTCDHDETDHDPETGICLADDCPCTSYEQNTDPADVADRLADEHRDKGGAEA